MANWISILLLWLTFLGLTIRGEINVDHMELSCIVADAQMNYENKTGVSHDILFYCLDTQQRLKCTKMVLHKCVVNDDGFLRLKTQEDEGNRDLSIDNSCDCDVKGYLGELWCNCGGRTIDHRIRKRSVWRWRFGDDPLINDDGVPKRTGYWQECYGTEVDEDECKKGWYLQDKPK